MITEDGLYRSILMLWYILALTLQGTLVEVSPSLMVDVQLFWSVPMCEHKRTIHDMIGIEVCLECDSRKYKDVWYSIEEWYFDYPSEPRKAVQPQIREAPKEPKQESLF